MVERIRFHLDEQVDPDIARALRRRGIDVTTTMEAGLRTSDDTTHLSFVVRESRVIVTHDADFLRIARRNNSHPGIVFCQIGSRTIGEIIRSLTLIYEVLTPDEMIGHVEYL
jgi:predicted nuclease of predicted toxin-antitoxin system